MRRSRHACQDVLEARAGHRLCPGVEEQLGRAAGWAHFQPSLHRGGRLLPERQDTLAAPLADDVHAGHGLAVDLIEPETDQLRHAHACGEGQMQHGSVSDAGQGARVRRVEQSLQLVTGEIADERLIGLLHRDRMDPTRLVEAGRHPVFQEAEERVDRSEPGIAGSRRVAALLLQMLQECQDQRRIEPLDLDLRRL